MKSRIVYNEQFLHSWPFAVDRIVDLWSKQGDVETTRVLKDDERPLGEIVTDTGLERLILLRVPITATCIKAFPHLKELGIDRKPDDELLRLIESSGVRTYSPTTEGFWGESVAECGLALTLCGLRRIPQLHHQIITDQTPWDYSYRVDINGAVKAGQFCDDERFTHGTVEGKKVRIVGVGNIGSRYASFMSMLGADVAAWDPFASEPCFHRVGARRVHYLEELLEDAEIFAPMVPLLDSTRGMVTAKHISGLPTGCLIVLVTRAKICDMDAIRARVEADEIALAADVHDVEPLTLSDPLLGRHNVVHTPHIAGRTLNANNQWAEMLVSCFRPM